MRCTLPCYQTSSCLDPPLCPLGVCENLSIALHVCSLSQRAVFFVDDLNAAGCDVFGTQSAIELLRQWCSMGGWHDDEAAPGKATRFKSIVDTQLLACVTTSQYHKT